MLKLSPLQQYILKETWLSSGQRLDRDAFLLYYTTVQQQPTKQLFAKIITHSVERLIERGLAVGHGHRTREKWHIDAVSLTLTGKRVARTLIASQPSLPLKKPRRRKKK